MARDQLLAELKTLLLDAKPTQSRPPETSAKLLRALKLAEKWLPKAWDDLDDLLTAVVTAQRYTLGSAEAGRPEDSAEIEKVKAALLLIRDNVRSAQEVVDHALGLLFIRTAQDKD